MSEQKYPVHSSMGLKSEERALFRYELSIIDDHLSMSSLCIDDFIEILENEKKRFLDEGFEGLVVKQCGNWDYTYLAIVGDKPEPETDFKKRVDKIRKKKERDRQKRLKQWKELKKEFGD